MRSRVSTLSAGVLMVVLGVSRLLSTLEASAQTEVCGGGGGFSHEFCDGLSLLDCTKLIESGTLKGPDLAEAYVQRSSCHPLEERAKLRADLEKAIEIDPRNYYALSNLGRYYRNGPDQNFDRAIEYLTKAIDVAGDAPQGVAWTEKYEAYLERRSVYEQFEKYELAIKDTTRLMELHAQQMKPPPMAPEGLRLPLTNGMKVGEALETDRRAGLYLKVGKLDLALADIDRALALTAGDDAASSYRAGWLSERERILKMLGRK
ncbi:MAG: hypothetical protein J2P50_06840 [Hyphomicrobiaceae bacterium]|nr:hypothetical protein [Hyphomicrobiaceae bacterium]